MTTDHIFPYINLILVLFFITFFVDIFYQYFRYKTLMPRKMLSFKKGGLFEHYYIVLAVTAFIAILHLGFGVDPFMETNAVSIILSLVTTYFTALVFLVFFFIFILYLGFYIYARIKKFENRNEYLSQQGNRIVKASFYASFVMATGFIIVVALSL